MKPSPPAHRTRRLLVPATLLVTLVAVVAVWERNRDDGGCHPASAQALSTIASGARQAVAPLTLTGAVSASTVITSTLGDRRPGILVAATTPRGRGVWVMDRTAYSSTKGIVYALDDIAESTTIWGAETNYLPVSSEAIDAIRSCTAT